LSNRMTEIDTQLQRPMRADARRNYEKLVAAARDVFTEEGGSAPLEDVAERAGVGIGTLYRHFPTRQALLEAVYSGEVEALATAATELAGEPPWEALEQWLRQYAGFAATKRALTEALLEAAPESDVMLTCRTALIQAATPLVERAQQAGVVRSDTDFADIVRTVSGVSVVAAIDAAQKERMLQIVLDGLRPRPA
jgi:AcrR family transcriptional regulator